MLNLKSSVSLFYKFCLYYMMSDILLLFSSQIPQTVAKLCTHTVPDVNGRVLLPHGNIWCCACNQGEFVDQFCQSDNPDTTQCALCIFDKNDVEMQTYVEHGFHLQNQCNKSITSCQPDFFRMPGNRSTPAKCYPNSIWKSLPAYQTKGIPYPADVIILGVCLLAIIVLVAYIICKNYKNKKCYKRVAQNVDTNVFRRTAPSGDNNCPLESSSNSNGNSNYTTTEIDAPGPTPANINNPQPSSNAVATSASNGSDNVPGPSETAGMPNGPSSPQQTQLGEVRSTSTTTDGASSLHLLGAGPMHEPTSTSMLQHRDQHTIEDDLSKLCPKCGPNTNTKTAPQSRNKAKKTMKKNLLDQIALVLAKMLTQADATFFLRTFGASTDDIDEAKSKAADARDMFFRVFEKCERSPCGQKLDSKNILKHMEKNHLSDCASEVRDIIAENDS